MYMIPIIMFLCLNRFVFTGSDLKMRNKFLFGKEEITKRAKSLKK